MAEAITNGKRRAPRREVIAELEAPPPGIAVDGVVTPAVIILRAPDGGVRYSLQGVSPLEAPTVVEVGLRALRRDLGLAPLGGTQ